MMYSFENSLMVDCFLLAAMSGARKKLFTPQALN